MACSHTSAQNYGPRVKKTSLGESLEESHAYNPIRDPGETLGEREKSRQEFRQASPQSLESDYMHGSLQDSPRDSFFHAGLGCKVFYDNVKCFSSHIHAKPLFAHRLQAAKMASSRTSAQNNGPRAQNDGP